MIERKRIIILLHAGRGDALQHSHAHGRVTLIARQGGANARGASVLVMQGRGTASVVVMQGSGTASTLVMQGRGTASLSVMQGRGTVSTLVMQGERQGLHISHAGEGCDQ